MLKRILSVRYVLVAFLSVVLIISAAYELVGTHTTPSAHATGTSHWLYVVEDGTVYIYDIDNNHTLLKTFSIPETGKRGIVVSPSRGYLYVSYCGATDCGGSHGSLLAYDLVKNNVAWNVHYTFGVDQPAITPDGSKIYMPHGSDASDGITSVIDASNGNVIGTINTGTNGHNVVASLDGAQVYITGYSGSNYNYIHVVNPATDTVVSNVGPTINGVRPFTVNGKHTMIFTTSTNTCGFQVFSLTTGSVLYTVPFSGSCAWSVSTAPSHGISLSPDEKRVYVMDAPLDQLEVYDVSGLPTTAPTFVASVQLGSLSGYSSSCQTYCEREGWVLNDLSGRYVYVGDSGDVVDTSTLKSVQTLPALQNTRQMVEIDWTNDAISVTSTRFGLGRVTSTSPTPTPTQATPTGPVNKDWYFAEGRVGKGFREYLSIENPSSTSCTVGIYYSFIPDGGRLSTRIMAVTIHPFSRWTESVHQDLGYTEASTTAANVAAIVTVDTTVTPNCKGVVAERPMYFRNYYGISSGTDMLGTTTPSTSYYFADVPSSANMLSYLTMLNPNDTDANVTATYYLNGSVVGTQTAIVGANARGTISPGAITLPAHVAAVVTASQPIVVERPTYLMNAPVNGAYDIVGATNLAQDWLFAEGYTTNTSQEYLTIANLDPANTAATVNITLKSNKGVTHTSTITVNARTQIMWNVNANNNFAGASPEVSAEVTAAAGANIVVQREIYFTYKHKLTNGRAMTAIGATDVVGQIGPATHTAYSFAEGYANVGYNDWLTIQNPTNTEETITVALFNGKGQTYLQNESVPANARFTLDTASIIQGAPFYAGSNSDANSFSMTVQSTNNATFVAERPIYFNTSGSSFPVQGGDDIIGYVGG